MFKAKETHMIQRITEKEINAIYQSMLENIPQFAKFVKENEKETTEGIMKKYGIDFKGKQCSENSILIHFTKEQMIAQ